MNGKTKNEKGIILLGVIVILLTMALIGSSLVVFFYSLNVSVRAVADEAKAFYLAEAGIAHAIVILRNQKEAAAFGINEVSGTLGEGTYKVKINLLRSMIISVGEVNDVKKTLQLQFSNM